MSVQHKLVVVSSQQFTGLERQPALPNSEVSMVPSIYILEHASCVRRNGNFHHDCEAGLTYV
eukprot:scaffold1561_cov129-Cylindrotheca_fusiformis.AAC.6